MPIILLVLLCSRSVFGLADNLHEVLCTCQALSTTG
jgi:hypothetical protein